MFTSNIYTSKDGKNISYLLTIPDGVDTSKESLPLILFLHGAGERGTDTNMLRVYGIPKIFTSEGCKYRAVTLSPQCPLGETFLNNMDRVKELLDYVTKEYNIDKDRISCTGLSMGGFGTFEIAMQYPEAFCAIAPICGGGMEWRGVYLTKMPVWAFHGVLDTSVNCKHSIDMIESINSKGGKAKLTLYSDLAHNCWNRAYEEEELIPWLLSQKK